MMDYWEDYSNSTSYIVIMLKSYIYRYSGMHPKSFSLPEPTFTYRNEILQNIFQCIQCSKALDIDWKHVFVNKI